MKKAIRTILLIICIAVFCYSGYQLINIYFDYKKIDETYEGIADDYTQPAAESEEEQSYLEIDWNSLLSRNSDVKAWIQIPDTNVNYPILQGETNDTYIHSDIDGNDFNAGSIFVASENQNPFVDINTVIYGHNMKNGSMFHDIKSYTDQEFADEHPYIYIYLPDGTVSEYKVVSAHIISETSVLYNTNIVNIQDFYQEMLKGNDISVDFDANSNLPVITLSTCTSGGGENGKRNVVHAVLQRSQIDPKTEKMKKSA